MVEMVWAGLHCVRLVWARLAEDELRIGMRWVKFVGNVG